MIKQAKTFTLNLVAGANVVSGALMVLVGYSDRVDPTVYPLLACTGMVFPFFLIINLFFIFFWILISWKRLIIPLIAYALAYVPIRIYMPLHGHQEPPDGSLKVISYNVCGFQGNDKYDNGFELIYNYLQEQKPDIVCAQEDMSGHWDEMQKKHPELFPYNETVQVSSPDYWSKNFVGIHTRFPILKHERIEYESYPNGSVAFYLKVGSDTIIVINNHMEHTHLSTNDRNRYQDMLKGGMGGDTVKAETKMLFEKLGEAMCKRAPQAVAVHQYAMEHSRYPLIICGDFNDTPISYVRRTMSKGLTDCFVETGQGLGLSYNRMGFNFRIDHMMCSDDFTPFACKIDSKIDVSDHYPLVCWLKMRDNP